MKGAGTVEMLLKAGADPSVTDADGKYPADLAEDSPVMRNDPIYWKPHDGRYQ